MLAVKSMDVRDNFKSFCDRVFNGETLIVSRPKNENVVMMSESEYNDLQKAKNNAEYLAMLDRSFEQYEQGKTITLTMEELKAMESDDWVPTQKVLDFMEKMKNE
jgi:antitoxin YefM